MVGYIQLRSKRELIEKFIQENLPHIDDSEDIPDEFYSFLNKEKQEAIETLSMEEDLDPKKLEDVIGHYLFIEKLPLRDNIIDTMNKRPALKDRKTSADRISAKILKFIDTFVNGIAEMVG